MTKCPPFPMGLGVTSFNYKILLLSCQSPQEEYNNFQIDISKDGFNFENFKGWAEIITEEGKQEEIKDCSDFRISRIEDSYFLTYKKRHGKSHRLCKALWGGFSHWQKIGEVAYVTETGMLVPDYLFQGKNILYFGGKDIRLAFSDNLVNWHVFSKPVITLPKKLQEKGFRIKIGTVAKTRKGILVIYFLYKNEKEPTDYSLKVAIFDKNNPAKFLNELAQPVWQQDKSLDKKKLYPLGVVKIRQQLFVYWQSQKGTIYVHHFPFFSLNYSRQERVLFFSFLQKFTKNPILRPLTIHPWESKAVFNTAAIRDARRVHFIYRAVGDDDISVWGYASSKDGVSIDERYDEPVYFPDQYLKTGAPKIRQAALPFHLSGCGDFGGCEDPRITKLDDRYYVTYTAFDGYSPPRVAITSIKADDFLNKRWRWKRPVFISPPEEIHKNWVIFPEKINCKYAILHSLSPKILIDYFDKLDFDGKTFIKSRFTGEATKPTWETRIRGAGPPPIKTEAGWLVLYHAMDKKDPGPYKMGALVLDYHDPTKVLYRAKQPILGPDQLYENEGLKPGIVYSCGAVVSGNQLLVYYGGADTVTCLATANLNEFLSNIMTKGNPKLIPRYGQINYAS